MKRTQIFSSIKFIFLCISNVYFAGLAGGALLILSLFSGNLSAQSAMCNQWYVEVCESPQPPGSSGPGCVDSDPCSPVFYYFYLKSVNTNPGTSTITFRNFSFTGQLAGSANPLATLKRLSKLNSAKSLACSPSDINNPADPASPSFNVSESDGTFSYLAFNANETNITWTLVDGRKLLFAIAIDAFPGEQVMPTGFSCSFLLPPPNVLPCTGLVISCDPIGGTAAKSVAVPDLCMSPLMLRIGAAEDAPAPGYPKRKRAPVLMTSSDMNPTLYTVDKLDFLSTLTTTQVMANIFIEGGKIPATDVLLYNEVANNSMNRRIYANSGSFQVAASTSTAPTPGNTLFWVVADGPALESDCGTIDLAFTGFRRMATSGACCRPRAGNGGDISWNSGNCPAYCPSTTITVGPASGNWPSDSKCEEAYLDVFIKNTGDVTYDQASIGIILHHSGKLGWNEAQASSIYCANMTACATATKIDDNNLRVDFSIDGPAPIELTSSGGANLLLRMAFKGENFCIQSAVIADARLIKENETNECLPTVVSQLNESNNSDDVCTKNLVFKYVIYDGNQMQEINYVAGNSGSCSVSGFASQYGSESICPCLNSGQPQTFTPSKDDNPLNGVTTYDLVLISKHILGIAPLGSPYKMIAADANKDKSITTFDIVELRKLILGIYQHLPGNTSWRFVPQDYIFPNPNNPFPFPENTSFTVPPNEATVSFYGIKVGDVNNTVVQRSEERHGLSYGATGANAGARIEVPVFAAQEFRQTAWQLALQYDASRLKLLDIRWPGALQPFQSRDWHETTPGSLRVLWYDGQGIERAVAQGAPLFYLRFECLADLTDAGLSFDPDGRSITYTASGLETPFQLAAAPLSAFRAEETPRPASPDWQVAVYPNPAGEYFRLEWTLPQASACRVAVYDMPGRLLWTRQADYEAGHHLMYDLPQLAAGQYLVRFDTGLGTKSLRLVKN